MAKDNEAVVAQVDDLRDGELKQVSIGDTNAVLARVDGQYYALPASCTHYGAPLAEGLLHGDRLICPWHHACFNVKTGDLLEPPAVDALPPFGVRVHGNDVIVTVPDGAPDRREMPSVTSVDPAEPRVFVILGGGAAGHAAAEELRQQDFSGRIVLISADSALPYDRTIMSKDYLAGDADDSWVPLRPDDFYSKHAIETLLKHFVEKVDAVTRTISFVGGERIHYDALLLATGGTPRVLDVPGADLKNVFLLRTHEDANRIIEQLTHVSNVVVIGSSFIGMESAASLTKRKLKVTVVSPEQTPFASILGDRVGRMFQDLHMEQGVQFQLGHKVVQIAGQDRAEAVVLDDGSRIATDLVLIGVGVEMTTSILEGVPLEKDRSVRVDAQMQALSGLYVAGDIATFPLPLTGKHTRVEHWRLAQQHGRTAARAMLGQSQPYAGVPFFWTAQFEQSLRYVGHTEKFDEIIYWGDPASRTFLALYVKDGIVAAAAASNRDHDIAVIEELLRLKQMPTPSVLRSEVDLARYLTLR